MTQYPVHCTKSRRIAFSQIRYITNKERGESRHARARNAVIQLRLLIIPTSDTLYEDEDGEQVSEESLGISVLFVLF